MNEAAARFTEPGGRLVSFTSPGRDSGAAVLTS